MNYRGFVNDALAAELAEHLAEPFPTAVERGRDYGEVDPVLIDADIYGWASRDYLDEASRASLRQAADELARSLEAFPDEARSYYARLVRIAHLAAG